MVTKEFVSACEGLSSINAAKKLLENLPIVVYEMDKRSEIVEAMNVLTRLQQSLQQEMMRDGGQ